jgi:hypothetical protein
MKRISKYCLTGLVTASMKMSIQKPDTQTLQVILKATRPKSNFTGTSTNRLWLLTAYV